MSVTAFYLGAEGSKNGLTVVHLNAEQRKCCREAASSKTVCCKRRSCIERILMKMSNMHYEWTGNRTYTIDQECEYTREDKYVPVAIVSLIQS